MIKQALPIIVLAAMFACNNQSDVKSVPAAVQEETVAAKPAMPELAYPVKRLNWEVGDPNNIKTVLELYKAWDDGDMSRVLDHFADTLHLNIPGEKEEISLPKNKINEGLRNNRSLYKNAANEIITAMSLKCSDTGEEWVIVTTYNKWIEKSGKRDSLIYQDDWLLTNGKIKVLISFDRIPIGELIKSSRLK